MVRHVKRQRDYKEVHNKTMKSWVKFTYIYHIKHSFRFDTLRQWDRVPYAYDYKAANMVINMMSDTILENGNFNSKEIIKQVDRYVVRL